MGSAKKKNKKREKYLQNNLVYNINLFIFAKRIDSTMLNKQNE